MVLQKARRWFKDSCYIKGFSHCVLPENKYVHRFWSSLLRLPAVVRHFNDECLAAYVFRMDVE